MIECGRPRHWIHVLAPRILLEKRPRAALASSSPSWKIANAVTSVDYRPEDMVSQAIRNPQNTASLLLPDSMSNRTCSHCHYPPHKASGYPAWQGPRDTYRRIQQAPGKITRQGGILTDLRRCKRSQASGTLSINRAADDRPAPMVLTAHSRISATMMQAHPTPAHRLEAMGKPESLENVPMLKRPEQSAPL